LANVPAIAEAEDVLEQGYDASDEEQVAKARKKGGRNRRARLEMVEAILQQEQGRKYYFDLLEKCYVFGNPLVIGDTHATYFQLGMQNIGKLVLQDIQEFPALYVQMMGEGKENK